MGWEARSRGSYEERRAKAIEKNKELASKEEDDHIVRKGRHSPRANIMLLASLGLLGGFDSKFRKF